MGKIKEWITAALGMEPSQNLVISTGDTPTTSDQSDPSPGYNTQPGSSQPLYYPKGSEPGDYTPNQLDPKANRPRASIMNPTQMPFYYPKEDPKPASEAQTLELTVADADCLDCKITSACLAVVTSGMLVKTMVLDDPPLKLKTPTQRLLFKGLGLFTTGCLLVVASCRIFNWGPFTIERMARMKAEQESKRAEQESKNADILEVKQPLPAKEQELQELEDTHLPSGHS